VLSAAASAAMSVSFFVSQAKVQSTTTLSLQTTGKIQDLARYRIEIPNKSRKASSK
jgi:hypothetical protein